MIEHFEGRDYLICAFAMAMIGLHPLILVPAGVASFMMGWETYLFLQRFKHDRTPHATYTKRGRRLCTCWHCR